LFKNIEESSRGICFILKALTAENTREGNNVHIAQKGSKFVIPVLITQCLRRDIHDKLWTNKVIGD